MKKFLNVLLVAATLVSVRALWAMEVAPKDSFGNRANLATDDSLESKRMTADSNGALRVTRQSPGSKLWHQTALVTTSSATLNVLNSGVRMSDFVHFELRGATGTFVVNGDTTNAISAVNGDKFDWALNGSTFSLKVTQLSPGATVQAALNGFLP